MSGRYVPGWATLHSAAERAHEAADASAKGDYEDALHAIRSTRARLDAAQAAIEATAPAVADELDAGPRVGDTITTAEQLDALPVGTHVQDSYGVRLVRRDDGWAVQPIEAVLPGRYTSAELVEGHDDLPFTVTAGQV